MLQKSTIQFLRDLKNNNNREWFQDNKKHYQAALADFTNFVEQLLAGISKFDSSMKMVKAKECIFRINRDVRFSADKSPYKTNFGANMAPGGRKDMISGYYIHVEDPKSFYGGGCYMPPADVLDKIRKEIAWNYKDFKKIIENKKFIEEFKNLDGDKLKKAPKGFDPDDPAIEILKHKSFIAMKEVSAAGLTKNTANEQVLVAFKALKPLNDFMRHATN